MRRGEFVVRTFYLLHNNKENCFQIFQLSGSRLLNIWRSTQLHWRRRQRRVGVSIDLSCVLCLLSTAGSFFLLRWVKTFFFFDVQAENSSGLISNPFLLPRDVFTYCVHSQILIGHYCVREKSYNIFKKKKMVYAHIHR